MPRKRIFAKPQQPTFPPKAWTKAPLQGWNYYVTPRGYSVIELDFVAAPDKRDPEFIEQARSTQPSERDLRREYFRDWTASSGKEFYPEYQGVRSRILRRIPGFIPSLPICRGWDFGFRHPACVWFQKVMFRMKPAILVYREFMPSDLGTHDFRDCVLYLSGELPYEELGPLGMGWIERIRNGKEYPKPPWFQAPGAVPLRFEDFSGPEATKVEASAKNVEDRTAASVLAARGIFLNCPYVEVESRVGAIRKLFREVWAGEESLIIDPACVLLDRALGGGLHFPKATPGVPLPDKPRKDNFYENIHDAWGYGLLGVISASDYQMGEQRLEYQDREPHLVDSSGPSMGFYETEKGRKW